MNFEGETYTNSINQKEMYLDYDDYYLAINFAALNYNRPEKNKFAYEEHWNYTSAVTPVTYTNLKAGEYTFKVKAANNDGYWNEEPTTITIHKKMAFWETIYLYFYYLLPLYF